jgi:sirohydrochlorin ferrochelatase
LLEVALAEVDASVPVVVALMFLQPGKHAGAGGDIAQIIAGVRGARPGLVVHATEVLGVDPLLLDILADRLHQAVGVV